MKRELPKGLLPACNEVQCNATKGYCVGGCVRVCFQPVDMTLQNGHLPFQEKCQHKAQYLCCRQCTHIITCLGHILLSLRVTLHAPTLRRDDSPSLLCPKPCFERQKVTRPSLARFLENKKTIRMNMITLFNAKLRLIWAKLDIRPTEATSVPLAWLAGRQRNSQPALLTGATRRVSGPLGVVTRRVVRDPEKERKE